MSYEKSEREGLFLDILTYCKISKNEGAVFATCDQKYHQIAEELIARGWLLETTEKYMCSDSKDRCFELTALGEEKSNFITIGLSETMEVSL